ncbi:hypothetical protein CCACVL1_05496 [Corchorus capsularis]|uniref:Uncharacterized protein n=1 Tax=Corchorus capsularis TaxID=210143 RepID=A0A1R3JKA7_COCAP|nr:hypothetical protein CCACVL1_05496 [Corchorus capsularis]
MSEIYQEPDLEVPNEEEDDQQLQESINLQLLRLDSFKNNQQNRHGCATCACNPTTSKSNPMKHTFPESASETKPEKPFLDNGISLSGFSKLPLPQLHRSVSDHYTYTPPRANLSERAKVMADAPFAKATVCGSASPFKPPVLRKSLSDHYPSPVKSSNSSSSNEMGLESIEEDRPSAKRVKRMKEWMKEMNQWVYESSREDGDVCNTEATKEDSEVDCEEAVRVQKIGDCLDLLFKCPCGKGYQILLSGQNCYYKLI